MDKKSYELETRRLALNEESAAQQRTMMDTMGQFFQSQTLINNMRIQKMEREQLSNLQKPSTSTSFPNPPAPVMQLSQLQPVPPPSFGNQVNFRNIRFQNIHVPGTDGKRVFKIVLKDSENPQPGTSTDKQSSIANTK